MTYRRVHIVVNPVAGQQEPVLKVMNEVFGASDIDWEISITKGAGDGCRQAKAAVEAGAELVAAYGGDGTVTDVASGLMGSMVPLAILPGGTANVMAAELGIPVDLRQACALIADGAGTLRAIDMGVINDHNFLLRVGIGFEAAMVEQADRELKERFGNMAYLWAALQNVIQPEVASYRMILDGKEVEAEGITCLIANSGNLAQRNLTLIPGIDVSDGLLDVIVIQPAGLRTLIDLIGSIAGVRSPTTADEAAVESSNAPGSTLQWWQAKEVWLAATPVQTVQFDGEVLGAVPIHCHVRHHAIRVLIPESNAA
jgi:diacylglycerol kinase (ATP)